MEFFLNGTELSLNSVNSADSGNLINHWTMNWAQFKDPVSHMCLVGTVVTSWSLTQEVAGSSPFAVVTNTFATEFAKFSETLKKNSNIACPLRVYTDTLCPSPVNHHHRVRFTVVTSHSDIENITSTLRVFHKQTTNSRMPIFSTLFCLCYSKSSRPMKIDVNGVLCTRRGTWECYARFLSQRCTKGTRTI